MDIDNLDYESQFDAVFSNATLLWVKDHQQLLRNARRALRAGGRLCFNFAGEGELLTLLHHSARRYETR